MTDIRDMLFRDMAGRRFLAALTAERSGVLAGTAQARQYAADIGVCLELCRQEGEQLTHGERFATITGTPKQIAQAEEQLIGALAKASGIATAAWTAVQLAGDRLQIVAGAWKKMPPQIKQLVRSATTAGGARFRICEPPMVYLDKNFIRMFGSIGAAAEACRCVPEATVAVQIRAGEQSVRSQAEQAIAAGCDILMVDTGDQEDLRDCVTVLQERGLRSDFRVAFGGGIRFEDIPSLADSGADILCIGRQIVDAPLLDMRLDVLQEC